MGVTANDVLITKHVTSSRHLVCAYCKEPVERIKKYPNLDSMWRGLTWQLAFVTGIMCLLNVFGIILYIMMTVNVTLFSSIGISVYIVVVFCLTYIWLILFNLTQHEIPMVTRRYLHAFIISRIAYSVVSVITLITAIWIQKEIITFAVVFALLAVQSNIRMVFYIVNHIKETNRMRQTIAVQKYL